MYLLEEMGEVMLMLAGALVAAILISWMSWTLFKLVRHPEWGPCLVLLGLMVTMWTRSSSSPFLQTTAFFTAVTAMICWGEGDAWRARRAAPPMAGSDTAS
ncbi:MAG: hypothetical protein WC729_26430 [Sphingomonas sp.]|jgi:sugar phosphate permease|uniref:hypothetical protein n=1 Tax=Sphingomonas sp. TaxID=28214 RepID=UPI0035642893